MAPLLPSTRLFACPACHEHVHTDDAACPHCGAELRGEGWVARAASAVLISLALSGCPDKDGTTTSTSVEPEYGVATSGMSTGSTGGSTGGSSGSTGTPGTTFEPEYGVPTSTSVGTTTMSTTTSTTTTTGPEPDYGVPQTTGSSSDGTAGSTTN